MTDFRNEIAYNRTLLPHLKAMEGNVNHFYCDNAGLVTIGIGCLVDKRGVSVPERTKEAKRILARSNLFFTNSLGKKLNTNLKNDMSIIMAEWESIRNSGAGARRAIFQLTLAPSQIEKLLETKINRYVRGLLHFRSFAFQLDTMIQIAIIDTRFNPGQTNPFSYQKLWQFMNPVDDDFDLKRAIQVFETTWDSGSTRYRRRHQVRVQWFRQGINNTP